MLNRFLNRILSALGPRAQDRAERPAAEQASRIAAARRALALCILIWLSGTAVVAIGSGLGLISSSSYGWLALIIVALGPFLGLSILLLRLRTLRPLDTQVQERAERPAIEETAHIGGASARAGGASDLAGETTPLSAIGLSTRLQNKLMETRIATVGDLLDAVGKGEQALMEIPGIGPKSLAEILDRLQKVGFYSIEGEVEQAAEEAIEQAPAEALARGKQASDLAGETTPLSAIGLSTRLQNKLMETRIATVGDLLDGVGKGEQALMEIPGIGPKSMAEILNRLETAGFYPIKEEVEQAPAEAELAEPELESAEAVAPSPRGARESTPGPRIICIVNRKGGVGKTTTTFNLAGALALMGYDVLMVDLDPMGTLCRSLRVYPGEVALSDVLIGSNGSLVDLIQPTHVPQLHVIPGDPNLRSFEMRHGSSLGYRAALRDSLAKLLSRKLFPFVLIDCPPSLGLISGNALVAAREVIVPIDGSTYGMGALTDTMTVIRMVEENVNQRLKVAGLLLNNVDLGTIYDRTVLEVLKDRFDGLMFDAVIPASPEADESSQMGEPVISYAPSSWMAKGYSALAGELVPRGSNAVK